MHILQLFSIVLWVFKYIQFVLAGDHHLLYMLESTCEKIL